MSGVPNVLVAGHVTLDVTPGGRVPGGSAFYAALAWRALGARVRVATAAGPDFPLAAALPGVEVLAQPAPATTVFVNVHGPDGRRAQRVEAVAPPLDPGALPPAFREADVLHLAPVAGEVDLAAFRAAVRARFTGLGVQGWLRAFAPDGRVAPRPWPLPAAALAGVDAAVVGEDDGPDPGGLARALAAAVPAVAFTHGKRGCEVLARGRAARRVGVFPTAEVDPTGAGDVFSAGFFLGLVRGDDPAEAARLGAAAASVCVEGRGGEALGRIGEAWGRVAGVPAGLLARDRARN
jgi:sugar/nucleoside kinase (ribokinase family)